MIKLLKKIAEKGIKSSGLRIIYKYRKPYLAKKLRKKYQLKGSFITDRDFQKVIRIPDNLKEEFNRAVSDNKVEAANEILLAHLRNRENPKFLVDHKNLVSIKELFLKNYQGEVEAAIEKADRILKHDFKWITPNCPQFDEKINWHSAFSEGKSWPLDFFLDLDYWSSKKPGDIRQNWEFNRHQYFVTLGKAYLFTGNEKYAAEFVNQIDDWIDQNPAGYGCNWIHSQETAIRMVSWIWAFFLFINAPAFTKEKKIKVLKSLYQHADYTYLTLSHDTVTHNHLVSEVCGLAFFAILFPEFKLSNKWETTGLRIFERELLKQVWENGPQAELSTNYHLFVLDSFLNVKILLDKNDRSISRELNDRIEKMIEYVMNFLRQDGTFPLIGDNDSGRIYKLSEKDSKDRRSYLSTGAVLFNRPDFKYSAGKFYEESFWLLGISGLNKFKNINSIPPLENAAVYENIGNAFYKTGGDAQSIYFLFRSGPANLRKEVAFAHNHADYLNFNLSFGGVNFFVDPGTYQYSLDDNWRYYFRSTNAHNTISIDGDDHLDVKSFRFGIPEIKTARINDYQITDDYFYINAEHFGYTKKGINHSRKVFVSKESFVIIVDHISGTGSHLIRRNFNIGKAGIQQLDNSRILLELNNKKAVIDYLENTELSIVKGKEDPVEGWVSETYGEKYPSSIIYDELKTELPSTRAVIIYNKTELPFEIEDFLINEHEQSFTISNGSNQFVVEMHNKLNFLKKAN